MIHEKLNEKLQEWKTRCVNFINIVTQIQSAKESCSSFFESNNDIESRDIVLQMNFERINNQISEFQNNIASIETMNNTDVQFSQGFVKLIISEFINYNMNQLIYINANIILALKNESDQVTQEYYENDNKRPTKLSKIQDIFNFFNANKTIKEGALYEKY